MADRLATERFRGGSLFIGVTALSSQNKFRVDLFRFRVISWFVRSRFAKVYARPIREMRVKDEEIKRAGFREIESIGYARG